MRGPKAKKSSGPQLGHAEGVCGTDPDAARSMFISFFIPTGASHVDNRSM